MPPKPKVAYQQLSDVKRDIYKLEDRIEQQKLLIQQLHDIIEAAGTDAESEATLAELKEGIEIDEKAIASLQARQAEIEGTLPPKADAPAPKFDPASHPILKKALESTQPAKPVTFNTGDLVEARWTDNQWYKAKINIIMGSSAAPMYNVRFLDYKDETLTVDREAIRAPHVESKKRKADGPAVTQNAPPARTGSPFVISAPATVNPDAQVKKELPKVLDGPPQYKRTIGGEKALERKKNNWQSFVTKGPGKKTQKESMFRSGTTINSKVGFTGSGAGMTATHKRIRPNYKADPNDDDD